RRVRRHRRRAHGLEAGPAGAPAGCTGDAREGRGAVIPASPGLDWWLDLASLVLIVGAAVLTLAAGLGLVRFPDAMARLHAGTKPQILGLMLMIIAIGLQARSWSTL